MVFLIAEEEKIADLALLSLITRNKEREQEQTLFSNSLGTF